MSPWSGVLGIVTHPVATLRGLARAEEPPPPAVLVAVLAAGTFAALVQIAGNQIEPFPATDAGTARRLAGDTLSLTVPLLFGVFWYFEAGIVDAAARVMGAPARRLRYRRVIALTYPVLGLYALIPLGQSLLDRLTPTNPVNDWLGYVNLLVLGWFITLATIAAREVYELPGLNALAAALLPYAVLTLLLTVLSLVFAILQISSAA